MGSSAHGAHGSSSSNGMGSGGGGAPPKPIDVGALLSSGKPMDPAGFLTTRRIQGGFCSDCTVLAGKTTTVFADGSRATIAQGVYLHHAIAIDVTKPPTGSLPACPSVSGSSGGGGGVAAFSPFLGGAVDEFTQLYTTPDGRFRSGYYIANNTFLLQAEIVNYRPTEQEVFVEVDVEFVPGRAGQDASQGTLAATG
jgi:hypothetical protein